MRTEERNRAVRRVIDQGEVLLDAWAELGIKSESGGAARPISRSAGQAASAKDRALRGSRCYGNG